MKDEHADNNLRDLLRATYRTEPANPDFKERLRQRLRPARHSAPSGLANWRYARLGAPVVAGAALAIVGYNIWTAFSIVPINIPPGAAMVATVPAAAVLPSSVTTTGQAATAPLTTGNLEIRVTDAPAAQEVTSIVVTVASVEIHKAGVEDGAGWLPVPITGGHSFDLTQLRGLESVLAVADLPPSSYTQVRMDVTDISLLLNGEMKTAPPPGDKLKFVQPFDITAGGTTTLLFDFDALRSVVLNANGRVSFRPVIKLTITDGNPAGIKITSRDLPAGKTGQDYQATLAVSGGEAPCTWSVAGGSLPDGLTLDPETGVIAGTPTAGGATFVIRVVDSSVPARSATLELTINITP